MNLITGISSGLGRYLNETIADAGAFNRKATNLRYYQEHEFFDTIVHCAWDTGYKESPEDYINNALSLVRKLNEIPHKQFIFLSSIDVYPKFKKFNKWKEDDVIDIRDVSGIYGMTKLLVEEFVLQNTNNPLILRPSVLLGPYTRGTVANLARNEDIKVSINSDYNFALYDDILDIINYSRYKTTLTGIYNVVAKKNAKLFNICDFEWVGTSGNFKYKAGYISNDKISGVIPSINQTSKQKYNIWKQEFLF